MAIVFQGAPEVIVPIRIRCLARRNARVTAQAAGTADDECELTGEFPVMAASFPRCYTCSYTLESVD
jgi:hypothetical protein